MDACELCNNKIHDTPDDTENHKKDLQIITHPFTLQSARILRSPNTNPWITVQPVNSILTIRNLQLVSCFDTSSWPTSLQEEDLQCDCAHVAKPHPHQQQGIAHFQPREQADSFGWLQFITAVRGYSFEAAVEPLGSGFMASGTCSDLGGTSHRQHLIPVR